MTVEAHPVDTLLRALAGDPGPALRDVHAGRRLLMTAIAAEARPFAPRRSLEHAWWRRSSIAIAAVALVVAVVAVTGLLRPQPVTALGELSRVAERVEVSAPAAGSYLYTRSVESQVNIVFGADVGLPDRAYVAYVLPDTRDRWVGADGRIREEVAYGEPVFFDPVVAAAYAAGELAPLDLVGTKFIDEYTPEETVLGVRNWPTSSDGLLAAMKAYLSNQGREISEVAGLVDLAADLLRASGATPELRAAVLGALDELDVEVTARQGGDGVSVAIEYQDEVTAQRVLEFDRDANLVRDLLVWLEDAPLYGVPAGTAFFDSQLSPSRVVESLTRP